MNFRDCSAVSRSGPGPLHACRALYDFDGSSPGELSLREGELIKVLRTKTPAGGDDGWWEGEVEGITQSLQCTAHSNARWEGGLVCSPR